MKYFFFFFCSAEYSIRAGSSKISSGGVLVKVKKMHPHPKYDPRLIDYDVAVGELSEPLEFSKNIKPISLIKSEPGNNTIAISSGWGVTEVSKTEFFKGEAIVWGLHKYISFIYIF